MNSYINSMKTTVSEKGQITIPKAAREALGIKPGTVLEIAVEEGRLVGHKKETTDPITKWRGRGHLPIGNSVDDYLSRVRE